MGIGGPEGFGVVVERPTQSLESWRLNRRSRQARQEKAEPINRIHAVLASKDKEAMTPEERQILEIIEEARAKMNRQNR